MEALEALPAAESGDPAALAVVRRWPGWGAASWLFDRPTTDTEDVLVRRMQAALADDEYRRAAALLDTSFYTPAWLVTLLWDALVSVGFDGGTVLIPGAGAGRFAGGCPTRLRERCAFVGVEADPVVARIGAVLNPDMHVIAEPMEAVTLASDAFDVVIGNVPFSGSTVHDRTAPRTFMLHDYMVWRAARAVRPGGLVVLITATSTIDATRRPWADTGCGFVTAVRLPSGLFTDTHVAADLIVLRKGDSACLEPADPPGVADRMELPDMVRPVQVSAWWGHHNDLVAGQMAPTGAWRQPLAVTCPAVQIRPTVAACVKRAFAMVPQWVAVGELPAWMTSVDAADGRKEGSFHATDDGQFVKIVGGQPQPVKPSAELRALVELRDLAGELLARETNWDTPDEQLEPLRRRLRDTYRAYTQRWGCLNRGELVAGKPDPDAGLPQWTWRRPTLGGFRSDPDAALVWALEVYDQESGTAHEATILSERVNRRPAAVTRATNPDEALTISVAETGGVDVPRVAALLGIPAGDVPAALGERVVLRPDGQWVLAHDYLWGDIDTKLAECRAVLSGGGPAALADTMRRLEHARPDPVGPEHIRVALGAPWLPDPVALLEQFCVDVFGAKVTWEWSPATHSWQASRWLPSEHIAPLAYTRYGTPHKNAFELMTAALNGKAVTITHTDPDTGKVTKLSDATVQAASTLDAIRDRFEGWVWSDTDRTAAVVGAYNATFNSFVPRRDDGRHLTVPGLAPHVELWPWQTDALDRTLSTPAVLCDLPVGAGKTLVAGATALRLRQLGVVNRPLYIVPGHLVEQAAREIRQAFPTANVLAATRDDMAGERRRTFAARCALGDWDLVIMSHDSFKLIPLPVADEHAWLVRSRDRYEAALRNSDTNSFTSKEVARRLRTIDNKMRKLREDATDPAMLTFDQLGVDHLQVDECVAFKRLGGVCHTDGFNPATSARALDLHMKTEWLRDRYPTRPTLVLYTATPWTNSILETFTWQTLCQPDRLAAAGLDNLDAWIASFVTMTTRVEPSPEGASLRTATRPLEYTNVGALMRMLSEVAVLVDPAKLPLDRPTREDHLCVVDRTSAQASFVADLADRADRIRRGGVPPERDNMLKVCGEGRAVALDPQLVALGDPTAPKLGACATEVARLWAEHQHDQFDAGTEPGAFQMVFCDLGTPKPGDASTYGRLRDLIVAAGVPADKVRWVHDATDDKAKAALFAACRNGQVAVLLASTETAGLGTNVQQRLVAIHHLDCPWRPSDLEQREGRGLRHGNRYRQVHVWRYIARETFDAFTWDAVARKQHIPAQMIAAATDPTISTVEELAATEIGYAELSAIASGNPLLLRHSQLRSDARRLRLLRALSAQQVTAARRILDAAQRRHATHVTEHENLASFAQLWASGIDHDHHDMFGLGYAIDLLRTKERTRPIRCWYHGVRLTVEHTIDPTSGKLVGISVTVDGYGAVGSSRAPLVTWRHRARDLAGGRVTARSITGDLDQWLGSLVEQLMVIDTKIDAAHQEIVAAQQVVDGWQFEHADELTAIETEMEAVSAMLHDLAQPATTETHATVTEAA